MAKYIILLLIIVSCNSEEPDEMKPFIQSLETKTTLTEINIILAGQSNAVGRNGDSLPYPSDLPANGQIPNAKYWNGSEFLNYTLQMNAFDDHVVDSGIEYRLAKYASDSGHNFNLLKYAEGGSTVVSGDWNADTGVLTDELISQANQAGKAWDAIVWLQGENDADTQTEAENYETELTKLINKFRANINGATDIKVIIVRLHDFNYPSLQYKAQVQQAQDNIYENMSNIELVIPPSTILVGSDDVHYTPEGLDVLGKMCQIHLPVKSVVYKEVNIMLCGQSNARGTSNNASKPWPTEINADGSRENAIFWNGDNWADFTVLMNSNTSDNASFNSGVEQGLAERFLNAGYSKVNLVKYCLGGSRIGESGGWSYPNGALTVGAINEFNQSGLQKIDFFIWLQGENDSTTSSLANAYEANLTGFINHMEGQISIDNFVIIKLYDFPSYPSGSTPYLDVAQQAQEDVAADMPRQMVKPPDPSTLTDAIHYDLEGLYKLAKKIFNQLPL